jgi:type II secretory pathway pseudopilin PulG
MPEFPEIPGVHELAGEEDEHHAQRFTRAVAVAIVLTTLAAAVTAFLQASSQREHDEAAAKATALASSALDSRRQSDQAARMLVSRYGLALEQRTRAAAELQRSAFAPGPAPGSAAERRRWLEVAGLTDRDTRRIAAAYHLPPVNRGEATGPDADRFFPQRYVASARRISYELGARRDAANQEAEEAHKQIGRYTISLTIFAVAVFLFGYSLTPHARRRRALYAGTAAALVLVAAISCAANVADAPQEPDESAAAAFAQGRVAYDSERYRDAVAQLDDALGEWPEYAAAYALRAKAEFAADSPQLDIPLSLTSDRALEASTSDQARALEHGSEDSGLVLEHGFQLLALGLRHDDDDKIEEGLRFSDQAREERPTDPVPSFNAGAGLLALGREDEARDAYREAVERTVFIDSRHKERRNDVAAYEFFLGEALTDLESIAAARPRLRHAVDEAKRSIVAPITRAAYAEPLESKNPSPPLPANGKLRIAAGPGFTQLEIHRPQHIGADADLSAQWYYDAPRGLGWSVLPDVSGAINDDLTEDRDGTLYGRGEFLAKTGSCLSPGRYRLELYVDGRLVTTAQRQLLFPALKADRLRELGLAFCRPGGWRPIAGAPGLLDGAVSPDHRAGMLVFSVNRRVAGARPPSKALSEQITAAALRRFADRLPPGLRRGGETHQSFTDLRGRVVRRYRYPGGRALVGAGATRDGAQLLVAVTYGPPRFMRGPGRAAFSSLAQEN